MAAAPRTSSLFTRRTATLAVVLVGVVLSVVSFRDSRTRERERAEGEFIRRTTVRHSLTREVLGRYEDALFALSALFVLDGQITRAEFTRAARRLEERTPGAQAYEWVPLVNADGKAAVEAEFLRAFPDTKPLVYELGPDGRRLAAAARPAYLPITYLSPITGNERALGYDLMLGPSKHFLDLARDRRSLTLTRQLRLVQEKAPDQLGLIMISPVWRPAKSGPAAEPDTFAGYVQIVFRTHDLLDRTRAAHPDSFLEMLFLDASESDPALRLLYFRAATGEKKLSGAPTEAEFRRGLHHELSLPLGGRDWRVLYRPHARWIEEQFTPLAWVRSAGVLALTALLAGLVHVLGRRTEFVEGLVAERTAELAASRRELDNLLHALPGMAYRCRYDERLTISFASDGALGLTGRPAADFLAGRVHFRDCIHPDDLTRVRDATLRALDEHRDFEIEYRIRLPDGTEKWVLTRGCGIYAADGALDSFEGLAIDITAQKNAEHERIALERKLLEGQKLESLGLLAGGIAHDFNNLLTGILGNASLARLVLPGSAADPQLHAIETASLRAAELCRQMLAYAGKGRFVVEPVDLGALAAGVVPLLEISIARRAALRLAPAPALPPVLADATQLRQIVMNLVLNAADAMGDRPGEIVLTTGVTRADHALLNTCVTGAGLAEGDYVFLEVRDTGTGMPPEVLAKIFDPFYTTKFAGRGLGLAAVLGIVRSHGGALHVASEPGRGSTFRLLLPIMAAGDSPARPASPPSAVTLRRHSGAVLVIEDEEPVRFVAAQILASLGFAPREASDGAAGLAAFRENAAAYEFVLLDLIMPGLSGEDTLAALRVIRPDVRVLFMSGYNAGDLLRRLASAGSPVAFLSKPFTRAALEEKLRELLAC